jgi:hypothetical protein
MAKEEKKPEEKIKVNPLVPPNMKAAIKARLDSYKKLKVK